MTFSATDDTSLPVPAGRWRTNVLERCARGQRFAGLFGSDRGGACLLTALLVDDSEVDSLHTLVVPDHDSRLRYLALSPEVPAAFWYERALHDLSGVIPEGHPRLDPLLLPFPEQAPPPQPGADGSRGPTDPATPDERLGPVDVEGHGMFTLPFGPVRSGVMESIEYLIETPGEDIPHLNIRPHYKHRGIAKQFEGHTPPNGVLVAERVEGISSVAHALAFSHAVEEVSGLIVPTGARMLRVVHAELERVANHLDVTMRLADAAGLAVATSRFGWHKESVLRIVSRLSGNRFGRGVVTIGGVRRHPTADLEDVGRDITSLHRRIRSDVAALEGSASFLDRVRSTGPLTTPRAREHGALGPIGRASGVDDDARRHRPYDGYADLGPVQSPTFTAGDALARTRVRWHEVDVSVRLVVDALEMLELEPAPPATGLDRVVDGFATGWAESAQGEVLYGLEIQAGRVRRCFARSASFHNLVLFHDVFTGDIFTDFPFIEASFGLSYAGVAM